MAYNEDDRYYFSYVKDGYSTSKIFADHHVVVLEIPVNKLLQHNAGDLSKLDENNVDNILSYLMKEPSPFNSIVPDLKENSYLLKEAHLFVVHLDHRRIFAPIYRDEPCWSECHFFCQQTLDLILEIGIPAKSSFSLWDWEMTL